LTFLSLAEDPDTQSIDQTGYLVRLRKAREHARMIKCYKYEVNKELIKAIQKFGKLGKRLKEEHPLSFIDENLRVDTNTSVLQSGTNPTKDLMSTSVLIDRLGSTDQ
jgi:hypothetical protein